MINKLGLGLSLKVYKCKDQNGKICQTIFVFENWNTKSNTVTVYVNKITKIYYIFRYPPVWEWNPGK